ncbi:MAG: DVU_1553 family AMP-dependent CoA ligase [Desulfitobacteriaceae bacterium]
MQLTPLEPWIAAKISGSKHNGQVLSRQTLEEYQLQKLRETLIRAASESVFYRSRLTGKNLNISSFAELSNLPFTTAEDIRNNPLAFLTISQGEIQRVVTLQSSGTTGRPKRIFFTESEQVLTIDFFQHGISTLVKPGERVLILLPGKNPGGVGDLLQQALEKLGAYGLVYGPVLNPAATLAVMQQEKFDCLVGIPVQVLALARYRDTEGFPVPVKVKSVLLSTDYVPEAVIQVLQQTWGCRVFNHYGSTEMGLGGGVECDALYGYHLREADLYFEIIDPVTGIPLPEGEMGEVVFTTLTRWGMPLIRYRTGDLSRFLPEPCPCGTVLKRLAKVAGRVAGRLRLPGETFLSMSDLDEAILPVEGVVDFAAQLYGKGKQNLSIAVLPSTKDIKLNLVRIEKAVYAIPQIKSAVALGLLDVKVSAGEFKRPTGNSKRTIAELQEG